MLANPPEAKRVRAMLDDIEDLKAAINHQKNLIREYTKSLQALEIKAARFGIHIPSHMEIEISDIQALLSQCNQRINEYQQHLAPLEEGLFVTLEQQRMTDLDNHLSQIEQQRRIELEQRLAALERQLLIELQNRLAEVEKQRRAELEQQLQVYYKNLAQSFQKSRPKEMLFQPRTLDDFVDVGVDVPGVVKMSDITDSRIQSLSGLFEVGDIVKVCVKDVNETRRIINFSMKLKKSMLQ
jgi:hypothetical protein